MKKLILIFFVIINTFIFSEEYVSGKITAKLGSVKENNLTTDMEQKFSLWICSLRQVILK